LLLLVLGVVSVGVGVDAIVVVDVVCIVGVRNHGEIENHLMLDYHWDVGCHCNRDVGDRAFDAFLSTAI
jgi:hypothetical protein